MVAGAVPLDVYLKATAALVCGTFSATTLYFTRVSPKERVRITALTLFTLAIALNQACEVAVGLSRNEASAEVWRALATVFAAADPLLLVWYLSTYDPIPRFARRPLVWVPLALSGFFASGPWIGFDALTVSSYFSTYLGMYTAITYLVVCVLVVRRAFQGKESILVAAAICVATIPISSNFSLPVLRLITPEGISLSQYRISLVGMDLLALASFTAALLTRHQWKQVWRSRKSEIARVVGPAILVWTLLDFAHFANVLQLFSPQIEHVDFALVGRAAGPVRWLVFTAFISLHLFREDPRSKMPGRETAVRVLLFNSALSVAGVVLAFNRTGVSPVEGIFILVLLAFSQGFRGSIDWLAVRLYGLPRQNDPHPGRSPTSLLPGDPPIAGQMINHRYKIMGPLGRGSHGETFLAEDVALGRKVAIKQVAAPAAKNEAWIAAKVEHKNVVRIYDRIEWGETLLLVNEFIPGRSLDEHVVLKGRLSWTEASAFFIGILEGLRAIHASGIIHLDLKPSNVMVSEEGEAKILDFSVSAGPGGRTLRFGTGQLWGTIGFMAPEQAAGERVSAAADLYAVGRMFTVAVEGNQLHPAFGVMCRALAADPAARWESASAMISALRHTTSQDQ